MIDVMKLRYNMLLLSFGTRVDDIRPDLKGKPQSIIFKLLLYVVFLPLFKLLTPDLLFALFNYPLFLPQLVRIDILILVVKSYLVLAN